MRVIIIEDDEGIGFSLRLALEDRGYDVELFADPTGVPYDDLQADVILVDFFMPKMDGGQVIKRLKQVPGLAGTRIMLMSAAPNLSEQAESLGVSYIAKPFDLDKLYGELEVQR